MRQIPGLALDDLRRTRVLALAWLALVAMEVGFMALPWSAVDAPSVGYAMLTFELARYVGIVVVAVRVIQRDPACDPQAAWRQTTPPLTLALAKITSTVLLGAVAPALVLALGLSLAGLPAAAAWRRAADLAADHAVVVSAAWLVAVPTRTALQALMAAVVALAAWVGGLYMFEEMRPHGLRLWMQPPLEVGMASAVATSMVLTTWMYVTRRRAVAIAIAVVCVAIGTVVPAFGGSALVAALNADPPALSDDAATITVRGPGAWREEWPGSSTALLSVPVRASSPRADRYFEPTDVWALLEAPSGQVTEVARLESARPVPRPASDADTPYANVRAVLGVSTLTLPPDTHAADAHVVMTAPAAFRGAVEAQGGRLAAYIDVLEHRLDTSLRVPPIAGARATLGASRVAVTRVSRSGTEVAISLHWLGNTSGGVLPVLQSSGGQRALLGTSNVGTGIFIHGHRVARMRGWKLRLTAAGERVTFDDPEAAGIVDPSLVLVADILVGRRRSALVEAEPVGRVP